MPSIHNVRITSGSGNTTFAPETPPASTSTAPTAPSTSLPDDSASIAGNTNAINPALFVLKTGDVMTGPLTLSSTPTVSLHAATKLYVDTVVAGATGVDISNFVLKTGSTMTGLLTLNAAPTAPLHAATKNYCDAIASTHVSKAGDTMTGSLVLDGAPTLNLHASTKAYVDTVGGQRVMKTGDTMSGPLILSGPPSAPLHAASKAYVDAASVGNALIFGFDITFVGTDPVSFGSVPSGWTVTTVSTGIIHVTHNMGTYPKGITGWGLTLVANTWKQALFGGNSLNITYASTTPSMFDINGVSTTTMNAAGLTAHVHIYF